MFYSFISDLINYINNKFSGQIPNLIYFAIGIVLGIIVFFIALLIVYLITKRKYDKEEKREVKEIKVIEEYKAIIESKIDVYNNVYQNADLKAKLFGIGKIILNMMEEIATLYYPESEDPVFEISIDQLVDFLSYINKRLNFIIDNLLEGKLAIVDVFTKSQTKDYKLGKLIEILNKNKKAEDEEKKKGILTSIKKKFVSFAAKTAFKITGSLIDVEFLRLLVDLGEDINKLYSNQKLEFTEISKKQLKQIKRKLKKAKKSVGDNDELPTT